MPALDNESSHPVLMDGGYHRRVQASAAVGQSKLKRTTLAERATGTSLTAVRGLEVE